jgi:hypothetical protein
LPFLLFQLFAQICDAVRRALLDLIFDGFGELVRDRAHLPLEDVQDQVVDVHGHWFISRICRLRRRTRPTPAAAHARRDPQTGRRNTARHDD